VKSKIKWRSQDVTDDTRNVESLPRRVAGNKWSQSKREGYGLQIARPYEKLCISSLNLT
jgi:hypothetical protein